MNISSIINLVGSTYEMEILKKSILVLGVQFMSRSEYFDEAKRPDRFKKL